MTNGHGGVLASGYSPAAAYSAYTQKLAIQQLAISRSNAIPEVENPFVPAFIITVWRRLRGKSWAR